MCCLKLVDIEDVTDGMEMLSIIGANEVVCKHL